LDRRHAGRNGDDEQQQEDESHRMHSHVAMPVRGDFGLILGCLSTATAGQAKRSR
jgi:hypothetical protein